MNHKRIRRNLIVVIAVLMSCATARSNAPELSLEDVVAKHLEAMGGKDKVLGIKTIRVVGDVIEGGVKTAHITQEVKRTDVNRMRMETQAGAVNSIQVYDGKDGWEMMPQLDQHAPTRMTAAELNDARGQAEIIGPLVTYKEKGLAVELTGHVQVDDADCYRVQIALADCSTLVEYIDSQTFLDARTEQTRKTKAGEVTTAINFGDYRKVEGLTIPFLTEGEEIIPKAQPQRWQFQAEKIEVNVEVSDNDFAMPPELAPTTQSSK